MSSAIRLVSDNKDEAIYELTKYLGTLSKVLQGEELNSQDHVSLGLAVERISNYMEEVSLS